jgi:AraC-like DNA-binding protein
MKAWSPPVPGIAEVFHAHFVDHAYPAHTHDTWTLLIVDAGGISYDLDRHEHGALRPVVTLLPPHVPHDGRSATQGGFRKRVLYLDQSILDDELIGAAVVRPTLADPLLRRRVDRLHLTLAEPGEELEAESRLAFIGSRLRTHLAGPVPARPAEAGVAGRLRELLDSRVVEGISLREAASQLGRSPEHLTRSFTRRFGMPPHQYLTGRRVDLARRLLLAGQAPAEVAIAAGFFDQAHLNRHFKRYLATTPGRFGSAR